MEALGSCLTNKYSEGYPTARYYGGTQVVDKIENLCISRSLTAFGLTSDKWAVNVQPYSGSPANFEVYTGLLQPHDRIMGLDLPSGGHLTHGYQTNTKKISATSVFFESMPYRLDPTTGLIDFEQLRSSAILFRPKILICGGSAYPRDWDYKKFRQIADEVGAILMCDMAHYAGLVAAKQVLSPFDYCDIVTSTTHKTLRGPRSGIIFMKIDQRDFQSKIAQAVFPGCQGGPHNHQIAAVAVQMKEVATEGFQKYSAQVKANANAVAQVLNKKGYRLVSGGTDTHLVLWDLKPTGISGGKMNILCDLVDITLNKNAVPGDVSALNPGGIRVGAPAMTSRGAKESDFEQVCEFLIETLNLAIKINAKAAETAPDGKVLLKQFTATCPDFNAEIQALKTRVNEWADKFEMPGLMH